MAVVSSCCEMLGLFLKRTQPSVFINCNKKFQLQNWMKKRMTSSPYVLYTLGYTRATMNNTIC